jgi:hypothetical protein
MAPATRTATDRSESRNVAEYRSPWVVTHENTLNSPQIGFAEFNLRRTDILFPAFKLRGARHLDDTQGRATLDMNAEG